MKFIDTKGILKNGWKAYRFIASKDGVYADYDTIIYSKMEYMPWECYDLAERHECEFWNIEELEIVKVR